MADRTLGPLDLGAVQARLRDWMRAEPDPKAWREDAQIILLLAGEVVRLGRLVTRAPAKQANGRRPEGTGDPCSCCGGLNLTRAGACLVCLDCGTSGGCS